MEYIDFHERVVDVDHGLGRLVEAVWDRDGEPTTWFL